MGLTAKGTTLTRVSFDASKLGSHWESDLGARNIAARRGFPPPEANGYLILVPTDESSVYSAPRVEGVPHPWDVDVEGFRLELGRVGHLFRNPIVFPFPSPPANHEEPNVGPMYWEDALAPSYKGGDLPNRIDVRNAPRRNNSREPGYSSHGVFVPAVQESIGRSDGIAPVAVIVIADLSSSMVNNGLATYTGGSIGWTPSAYACEPGLFIADHNEVSLLTWLADTHPNTSLRYWSIGFLPRGERWLQHVNLIMSVTRVP